MRTFVKDEPAEVEKVGKGERRGDVKREDAQQVQLDRAEAIPKRPVRIVHAERTWLGGGGP